jgi:hypothetical protein
MACPHLSGPHFLQLFNEGFGEFSERGFRSKGSAPLSEGSAFVYVNMLAFHEKLCLGKKEFSAGNILKLSG